MRKFSSYGPVDREMNYYAPRQELIEKTYNQLIGENPQKGGHYFTVWAPRQTGKTWLMQQIVNKTRQTGQFQTAIITMELAKYEKDEQSVVAIFVEKLRIAFSRQFPALQKISEIPSLFTAAYFPEPVILVVDEFDALDEQWINSFAGIFRDMFINRSNEGDITSGEKYYLLHGLALIGVRSVLGIENQKGSPFNVQRGVHIPNLTFEEVEGMFKWYEKESGQAVEDRVIGALYEEMRGQPGLTCWFGELLTEGFENYPIDKSRPITMKNFKDVYNAATQILPNNNIMNLISKVNKPPYDEMVIEFFKTGEKIEFKFDRPDINYLYMNGVIDLEKAGDEKFYLRFSCPFVQKRLFNYFSDRFFNYLGPLIPTFDAMEDAVDDKNLYLPNIIKRYQAYLTKNQGVFFKNVPRRKDDLRIYEAIYHFNLFRYLYDLLRSWKVEVIPHFPTGNGKIDLILEYKGKIYALELKSFKNMNLHEKGIEQAAEYGRQMGLQEVAFLVFVEVTPEEAKQLEKVVDKNGVKVTVLPIGIL